MWPFASSHEWKTVAEAKQAERTLALQGALPSSPSHSVYLLASGKLQHILQGHATHLTTVFWHSSA